MSVEFVSPVFTFTYPHDWQRHIGTLFDSIKSTARMEDSRTGSMHIHVSPPVQWSMEKIKSVCRGILWFEEAFEELVPEYMLQNQWSFSNSVDNPELRGLDLLECFDLIDHCTSKAELVHLMNALDTSTEQNQQRLTSRYYVWNLENIKDGEIQTIEYCRAPRVTNAHDCIMWSELATSFVEAAMQYGDLHILIRYNCTVERLKRFINKSYASESLARFL